MYKKNIFVYLSDVTRRGKCSYNCEMYLEEESVAVGVKCNEKRMILM